MNLTFEDRILGGSAEDAIKDIRRKVEDPANLNSLLRHEQAHMKRSTVIRVIRDKLKRCRS
ncbi:hypothetical protein [Endozoicomonas sp. 4G]|uniref:hypothetical protein n=1 Tax=Endozoicomonas sp. 4G TaxID=2872754 RepID=UPI0020787E00|nr:hypothetical protein [Endozoicomonas sp. 4G]